MYIDITKTEIITNPDSPDGEQEVVEMPFTKLFLAKVTTHLPTHPPARPPTHPPPCPPTNPPTPAHPAKTPRGPDTPTGAAI